MEKSHFQAKMFGACRVRVADSAGGQKVQNSSLEARGEARERRDQLVHPTYQKPELLATQANQLWSWDITKLA
jgi:hypothetical protein